MKCLNALIIYLNMFDNTMNSVTHPEMYKAMDKAAADFWAYPDVEWQNNFIDDWLKENTNEQN